MKRLSAAVAAAVLALWVPRAAGTRRRAPGPAAGDAGAHRDKLVNDSVRLWRYWARHHPCPDRQNSSAFPTGTNPRNEAPYKGGGCESYCEAMKNQVPLSELCKIPPCHKCAGCAKAVAANAPFLQVGRIKVGGFKSSRQRFKFQKAFAEVPVVLITANTVGPHPATIRIKDVTKEGFSAIVVEPKGEDGPHGHMDVPYMAVVPGSHKLSGGRKLEAGTISTKSEVRSWRCNPKGVTFPFAWETLKFKTKFKEKPALVTMIQTMANEQSDVPSKPSIPFLTVAENEVTAKTAKVSLERMELGIVGGALQKSETIGYVAMTTGHGDMALPQGNFVQYAAVLSPEEVVGWSGRASDPAAPRPVRTLVVFGWKETLGLKPLVVASQASHNGQDGGWVRIHRVSHRAATFTIDEDRWCDQERTHKPERIALIAWSAPCEL